MPEILPSAARTKKITLSETPGTVTEILFSGEDTVYLTVYAEDDLRLAFREVDAADDWFPIPAGQALSVKIKASYGETRGSSVYLSSGAASAVARVLVDRSR